MKVGDLVKIKLPSAKGLYVIVERTDDVEAEAISLDRCWKLYGLWYGELRILEMFEKWLEIVSETEED